MSLPLIIYAPRSDVTPENEREALASVYDFILNCHEEKKVAEQSSRASKEGKNLENDAWMEGEV